MQPINSRSSSNVSPSSEHFPPVWVLAPFPGRHFHEVGGEFAVQYDGDQPYFMDGSLKVVIPQEFVDENAGGQIITRIFLGSYQWAYDSNNVATLVQATR